MGIPMLKIRPLRDRLIFNMGILILARLHIYLETAPWAPSQKTVFLGMGIFHYKDKTVVRPSYLYNGNAYTGKTIFSWDGTLEASRFKVSIFLFTLFSGKLLVAAARSSTEFQSNINIVMTSVIVLKLDKILSSYLILKCPSEAHL